jgi:hypothetical protein
MTMKLKIRFVGFALTGFILVVLLYPALTGLLQARPTAQQRAEIQGLIAAGDGLRSAWVTQRDTGTELLDEWRETGDEGARFAGTVALRAANNLRTELINNRNRIIDIVDSLYDCGVPPGTEVKYDPDCGRYGYTSPRCYIRLCEKPFTSPDDVASTKIHEAEHVRQKQRGVWGPGNVPQKCWKRLHRMEYEARQAQLKAHGDGKIKLDTLAIQRLEREKDYCKSKFSKRHYSRWQGKKRVSILPGEGVVKEVAITNESDEFMEIEGFFENEHGWPMTPPGFVVPLASEEETIIEVLVEVPPMAEPGLTNELFCYSYAVDMPVELGFMQVGPDTAVAFFFIDVTPTVIVSAGDNVGGLPEDSVAFHFTVENVGGVSDVVQVDLESTLGWTLSRDSWSVPIAPSGSVVLESAVWIPDSSDFATDLIMCRAVSTVDPAQMDSSWLYATVEAQAGIDDGDNGYTFALMPSAPNPFLGTTLMRFSIPKATAVQLSVYDVRGRLVRTLVGPGTGKLAPGTHTIRWDGTDDRGRRVAGGVYFSRLRAMGKTASRKMVILR